MESSITGLQSRVAHLEQMLQTEKESKIKLQTQHETHCQKLKKEFKLFRDRWDHEKQKEISEMQKKLDEEKKNSAAAANKFEKQCNKKCQALTKNIETEKNRSKKELNKVETKIDKVQVLLQEFKARTKELEKELKKKERVLQKATTAASLAPYSRKRRRSVVDQDNAVTTDGCSPTPAANATNDTNNDGSHSGGENADGIAAATLGTGGADTNIVGDIAADNVTTNTTTTTRPRVKHEKRWQLRFEELQQFYKENGHSNVPNKYEPNPKLGVWVSSQRTAYRLYRMGEYPKSMNAIERMQKLKSVGFVFSHGPPPRNWSDRYQDLIQYSQQNGHSNVPQKFPGGLGEFVMNCRRDYREGTLSDDKINKLEEIGFQWSLRNRGGTLEDRMMTHTIRQVLEQHQTQHYERQPQQQFP